MNRLLLTCALPFLFTAIVDAQINFHVYAGTTPNFNTEDGKGVLAMEDSGFVTAGYTRDYATALYSGYLVKFKKTGKTSWGQIINATDPFSGASLQTEFNGIVSSGPKKGLVTTGYTALSGSSLYAAMLVAEFDANGSPISAITISKNGLNLRGTGITRTTDGGYAVCGYSYKGAYNTSTPTDVNPVIVKLSSTFAVQWANAYDGGGNEFLYSIAQTSDNGFVVAGKTDLTADPSTNTDALILKTDVGGNYLWSHYYGGNLTEEANAITALADGGCAAVGTTSSYGSGRTDCYIIRLKSNGVTQWHFAYGNSTYDKGRAVLQDADGNIVAGGTTSFSAASTVTAGYIFKVKEVDGSIIDPGKYLGSFSQETVLSVIKSLDGGYAAPGSINASSNRLLEVNLFKMGIGFTNCNAHPVITNLSLAPDESIGIMTDVNKFTAAPIGLTNRLDRKSKTVCTATTLRFSVKVNSHNQNLLQWDNSINEIYSSVVVEKSTDGINFNKVAVVNNSLFADKDVKVGDIYYRIAVATEDGSNLYSSVNKIHNDPSLLIKLYPNPADAFINLVLSAQNGLAGKYQVFDNSGNFIMQGIIKLQSDKTTFQTIDVSRLRPGIYKIKIANGQVVAETIFIKK